MAQPVQRRSINSVRVASKTLSTTAVSGYTDAEVLNFGSIDELDDALTTADATAYSADNLNTMSLNDKIYAYRLVIGTDI